MLVKTQILSRSFDIGGMKADVMMNLLGKAVRAENRNPCFARVKTEEI